MGSPAPPDARAKQWEADGRHGGRGLDRLPTWPGTTQQPMINLCSRTNTGKFVREHGPDILGRAVAGLPR